MKTSIITLRILLTLLLSIHCLTSCHSSTQSATNDKSTNPLNTAQRAINSITNSNPNNSNPNNSNTNNSNTTSSQNTTNSPNDSNNSNAHSTKQTKACPNLAEFYANTIDINTATNPILVLAEDFNADGNTDFAFTTLSPNMSLVVFLGDGNQNFSRSFQKELPDLKYPLQADAIVNISSYDVNHDGFLDLLLPSFLQNGQSYLFLGDQNGQFQLETIASTQKTIVQAEIAPFSTSSSTTQKLPYQPYFLATLQLDKPPLNIAYSTLTSQKFFNEIATIGSEVLPFNQESRTNNIAIGDIDNNGTNDIAYYYIPNNSIYFVLSNPNGAFATAKQTLSLGALEPIYAGIADFNQDGLNDVLVGVGSSPYGEKNIFYIFQGTKEGAFYLAQTIERIPLEFITADPGYIKIIDVNGDGFPDIVYQYYENNSYHVRILINKAEKNFEFGDTFQTGTSFQFQDINQDGALDLIYSDEFSSFMHIRLNKGCLK